MILIFSVFSCSLKWESNKCYYWKDKSWKCLTLDYLENNYIEYSKYGYIFKENKLIIDSRFKLFEKRNIDKLSWKIWKLKLFKVTNLDIFYFNKILEELKII